MAKLESYVTVEEANEIVESVFRKYDEFRVYWSVLSDEEKAMYLTKSAEQIDSLIYVGRKRYPSDVHQFPRDYEQELSNETKKAVVYNAVGFMNQDFKNESLKQTGTLESLGFIRNVKYNRRTSLAPDYEASSSGAGGFCPLKSKTAYGLLSRYTRGSFRAARW